MFFLFVVYALMLASPRLAAADNPTWTVRPGDTLEIISATLEIPKEEINKQNPGISETNLQIGQKLKLPFVSYTESRRLEQAAADKEALIGALQSKNGELEKKVISTDAQLFWHPVWFWGFWICFSVIAFIFAFAYWIFRQTHPRIFDEPHERSITDLKESQTRVRSSFSYDEGGMGNRQSPWRPPLKRLPHAR
jgi:hypothetical protein